MTDTTLAQRLEIALAEWDSYDPFASNDKAMAQAMAVIDASRALLPEIARLTAANKALTEENERLRAVVSNVCEALPNGAFCAPQCSIEFMEEVPKEVAIVCSDLSAKLAKVEAERDALKHDIARHIQIASDEATLADGLVASKARLSAELAEARKRSDGHLCGYAETGTYTGQVVLVAPDWLKHKWPNGIGIDVCLALEISNLWRHGIKTTGHCCGHGRLPAFISVWPEEIGSMQALGYETFPHTDGRGDHFVPKTFLSSSKEPGHAE